MTSLSSAAARLAQLESFLRQDSDNASLLLEAFDAALHVGLVDAAEFHLVHATRLGHEPARWALNAVHLALARHQWDVAIDRARELAAREPAPELRDALAHATAYALFRQGRFDVAAAALAPLAERDAGAALAPPTQALLLRVWHRLHVFEPALAWAAPRALAPEAAGVASLLALDAGDFPAAAHWLKIGLADGAPCAEALVTASSLATASRDAAAGQQFARQALAQLPDDGRSWSALGLAQMLAGELTEARDSLRRALLTMPDHVGTRIALGWAEMLLDENAQSLATFETAVDSDRNFGEAHGGLAAIQAKLGLREAALASIERARRLDASGLSVRYAQSLLDGQDVSDPRALLVLARRLLGDRQAPLGGSLADWLPPEPPAA